MTVSEKINFQSNILRSVFHGFRNSFKFHGKASRSEFATFYLGAFILSSTAIMCVAFISILNTLERDVEDTLFFISFGFVLLSYMASFSLVIRRLNDMDRSPFYVIPYFLPSIAWITVIILMFFDSRENPLTGSKPNHYLLLFPMDLMLFFTPVVTWILIESCQYMFALDRPLELRSQYSVF